LETNGNGGDKVRRVEENKGEGKWVLILEKFEDYTMVGPLKLYYSCELIVLGTLPIFDINVMSFPYV